MLSIVIIGAGGIGCYYGARLLDAGHRVVFTARGGHLQALQEVELTMNHSEFGFEQPVEAFSQQQFLQQTEPEQFDLVILTLKAMGTKPLLGEIKISGYWRMSIALLMTPVFPLKSWLISSRSCGETWSLIMAQSFVRRNRTRYTRSFSSP